MLDFDGLCRYYTSTNTRER